jgi:hypothetical protein
MVEPHRQGCAWSNLELQFSTEERAIFFASTTMTIGNGLMAIYWMAAVPSVKLRLSYMAAYINDVARSDQLPKGLHENSWARDIHGVMGIQETVQYLILWQAIRNTALTDEPYHMSFQAAAKPGR